MIKYSFKNFLKKKSPTHCVVYFGYFQKRKKRNDQFLLRLLYLETGQVFIFSLSLIFVVVEANIFLPINL